MKVAVIQFPGSNCERETLLALKRVGLNAEPFLWNEAFSKLKKFSAYVLVGGFSYEDRVRSGLIASMDPLMKVLKEEAQSGKAILGICNGAQILVESGLVPGLPDNKVAIALAHNKRILEGELVGTGFYNSWIHVKANGNNPHNAFSSKILTDEPMRIPAAHGEGRFLLTVELYEALKKTDAVFYYYCDDRGQVINEFPINPNGAAYNLAGVSNAQGNVLALMPHPERTPAGDPLFQALKNYLARWQQNREQALSQSTLEYEAPALKFNHYQVDEAALHYWVGLNIHDNEALSLESSLQAEGLPLKLKRFTHWQIEGVPSEVTAIDKKITESDFIFNRQKEYTLSFDQLKNKAKHLIIVRPFEDEMAMHKLTLLQHELKLPVNKVIRETIWVIEAPENKLEQVMQELTLRPILGNPLAHDMSIL